METETVAAPEVDPSSGDQSFEVFYAASADRVYRALAVTLGDAHLAREATDEAMARAFARWATVCRHGNPAGWAFRVGLNWATSWRRRLRRERMWPDDPVPDRTVGGAGEPGSAEAGAVAALGRLPVPQRAVVVCRVLFNLSTSETAAILRIAEGTVRSRLSRAIATLRTELGEEDR
jgi:RNA polymerase sigma-70 factor (ECF subfamily)